MQKITDSLAVLMESTTVSMETRSFVGSGEKKTRTLALPTVISSDQPDSLAVSGTEGSLAISFWRAMKRSANLRESNICSKLAWLVNPSGV